MNVEFFGYIASILIAVSFLMVSILKLRIINLFGCLFFVAYGVMIGSPSIIMANTFISGVQLFYLYKMWRDPTADFTYIAIGNDRKGNLTDFITTYKKDLQAHYPLFSETLLESAFDGKGKVFLALKKLDTVGFAFVSSVPSADDVQNDKEKEIIEYINTEMYPENTLYLNTDYILKKYRDMGLAQKLYNEMTTKIEKDAKFMIAIGKTDDKKHRRFLGRNGYEPSKNFGEYTLFVKSLA